MNKLFGIGLLIEIIGASSMLLFPVIFLLTWKKRFLFLTIISVIMTICGFYLTLL